MDLHGQLPAVFAGHRPLQIFQDGGNRGPVIFEGLRAIDDRDAGPAAHVFVVGALIGILEAAPAADVVDEQDGKVVCLALDVGEQLLERRPPVDSHPAFAFIGVGAHHHHCVLRGVFRDRARLALRRVLLVVRRHAHILRRAGQGLGGAGDGLPSRLCRPHPSPPSTPAPAGRRRPSDEQETGECL